MLSESLIKEILKKRIKKFLVLLVAPGRNVYE